MIATVFDPTVSVGSLIVALTTLFTGIGILFKLARLEAKYEQQHELMWADYKKQHGMNGNEVEKQDSDLMRKMFRKMLEEKMKEQESSTK